MKKLAITEKKFLKLYYDQIDLITEIDENKCVFTGREVCNLVIFILLSNKIKTSLSPQKLYSLYSKKTKHITDKDWRLKYGIPEIISLIYSILREKD
jgi:hypothetical protein